MATNDIATELLNRFDGNDDPVDTETAELIARAVDELRWRDAELEKPEVHSRPHTFTMVHVFSPDLVQRDLNDGLGKQAGLRIGYYIHSIDEWRIESSPSQWNVTLWRVIPVAPVLVEPEEG